jgi:NADH dehydrogenase FAD-containing subunit
LAPGHGSCREEGALTPATSAPRSLRRLVLVGVGRTHLELLRAFTEQVVRGVEIVLVTEEAHTFSSAMAVGLFRGAYSLDDVRIDVAHLAERAGVRLVVGQLSRIELEERVVVSGTDRLAFDVCSLDVLGVPDDATLPGVAQHALLLRNASTLHGARATLESWLSDVGRRVDCVVVGGGPIGVEAAFALREVLSRSAHGGVVTIVETASTILPNSPCRDSAHRALAAAGVCFALGSRAVEVSGEAVLLASGASLPADVAVWAAPGSPPAAIAACGLPHDDQGRLLVDAALRALDGAPVWAAGECAARERGDQTSIDESALLDRELRSALGAPLSRVRVRFRPWPCLLDTGDGRALVAWGAFNARSRWGWWLKRRRDRRSVAELARP